MDTPETLKIPADDKRLGKLRRDGSVERWPQYDCRGGRFGEEDRPNRTRRRIAGTDFFVVMPHDLDSDLLTIEVDQSIFTEPPEQKKVKNA